MGRNRDQRLGRDRNEAETGEPIQLEDQKHDEKQTDERSGEQRQGGQHQQDGQQPNRPAQARPDEKQQKPA